MTGIYWQEREPYTQSMNLIVSLLMRFPEIATVSLHPNEHSLHMVFILDHTLSGEEKELVHTRLEEGWLTFWQITHAKPELAEIVFTCEKDISFMEIRRDVGTLSLAEISYLIQFLHEYFKQGLCQESSEQTENQSVGDDSWPEELIELLLEDLREAKPERNLIGFREEGRVFVYRT